MEEQGLIVRIYDAQERLLSTWRLSQAFGTAMVLTPSQDAPEQRTAMQVIAADSPVVLTFPTAGNANQWHLRESQVTRWSELYPNVSVEAECRKALGWIEANPTKKKTSQGMPRFLNLWMSKAQDRGGSSPMPAASAFAARLAERIGA